MFLKISSMLAILGVQLEIFSWCMCLDKACLRTYCWPIRPTIDLLVIDWLKYLVKLDSEDKWFSEVFI